MNRLLISLTCWIGVLSLQAEENVVLNSGFEACSAAGNVLHWSERKPVYRFCEGTGRNQSRGLVFENTDPHFYSFPAQTLSIPTGCCYAFEVWVKAEQLAGDESGATICMEWSDAQGKFIGGAYAEGLRDTAGNWVRVHGATRVIPTNAVRITVAPYVRKGMTGKAWFDDIRVYRHYPPLVTSLIASTYRNTATNQPITFFAGLTLQQSGLQPREIEGAFLLLNEKTGATVLKRSPDQLSANHAAVTLPADAVSEGTYTAVFCATTRMPPITTHAQTTTLYRVKTLPQRKVWVDAHRRLIVNGQPFFPLGMYWSSVTPDLIATYRTGPFNCLMPYGAPNRLLMDQLHTNNLKVIYSIKDLYSGTRWAPQNVRTEADETAVVTRIVTEMKDHPALLAWYTNDELPATMEPRLAARQRLLERLDHDHPTWIVLYQYDDVRAYLRSFDIVGTDPYPIPEKPLTEALIWARTTREQSFNVRPIWQVPQAFDWAAYRKGDEQKNARAPSRAELRAMSWMSIAAGANGLIYYSFFDLFKMQHKDPFEKRWADICAVAEEIQRYIPLILSVEPVPSYSVTGSKACEIRVWRQGNDLYILGASANLQTDTVALTFAAPIATVETLFGNQAHSQGTTISMTLDALTPVCLRATLNER